VGERADWPVVRMSPWPGESIGLERNSPSPVGNVEAAGEERGTESVLSMHHGDVHYADTMTAQHLPVHAGGSASSIELRHVDDGHQAVINAALATRGTGEVRRDGHLEALTSEAQCRPENSNAGSGATGAAVADGSESAVYMLSVGSIFWKFLFYSETLRWRKRKKGVRGHRGYLGEEQQFESGDEEHSPAHAKANSLLAPAISPLRLRPLETYRRKQIFSNATVAVACIMYWAATVTLTSAYHSAGETIFGLGTCKATGPSHFQVTCTNGGLFKDSNGKSAYKRCGET
jgi:hypothetical protein